MNIFMVRYPPRNGFTKKYIEGGGGGGRIGAYQKPNNRLKFPSKPKNRKKIAQNRNTGENTDPLKSRIHIFQLLIQQRNIGFKCGASTGRTRLLRFSWYLSVAHNVTTGPDDVTGRRDRKCIGRGIRQRNNKNRETAVLLIKTENRISK